MKLTVQIPDDLAQRLSAAGGDLSRRALDGFLRAHAVFLDHTLDDLEQERQDLHRMITPSISA